jgi:hypothetical protein
MGKYEPLGEFLRRARTTTVRLTFADIERITGTKLPPSALRHRPWWSNNPNNSVMTKVWLDAGYRTEQVDMEARTLVFRRMGSAEPEEAAEPTAPPADKGTRKRHPLFGLLKGLMRVAPGTDLTKPADPDWGRR